LAFFAPRWFLHGCFPLSFCLPPYYIGIIFGFLSGAPLLDREWLPISRCKNWQLKPIVRRGATRAEARDYMRNRNVVPSM
jgi:hypothetical protein